MPARKIVFTNVSDFDAGGLAVFLGLSVLMYYNSV